MPDTGAPWNIPYVESTDLVSDWPTDSLALANAIDAGLDAAGGLVAVKHALFTGTQSASVTAGSNVAVTDLSITHTLADAGNKLIVSAYLGTVATSLQRAEAVLLVFDGSTSIGAGDVDGSRFSGISGGRASPTGDNRQTQSLSGMFVYSPGDTNAHTYTVRVGNLQVATQTLWINRNENDSNAIVEPRASSALVIQEVKV